jgi:hypothetical protein
MIDKTIFIGSLGINIKVADDWCWSFTSHDGYRYTDIVSMKLLTPPEEDATLLMIVVGPFALALGFL